MDSRSISILVLLMAPLQGQVPSDQVSSAHIRVDHFGYLPLSKKVAILREPVVGFDAPKPYKPSAWIEVRRADGSLAWRGRPRAWQGGKVQALSGDRVWWLDFSNLTEVGRFYVHDPVAGIRSENFEIGRNAYREVMKHAMRMFYYQRCGQAKRTPYAGASWTDGTCHTHAQQDLDCRSVLDPRPQTARNLSGGWHDAGDYNKYVNFADDAVHHLLDAWKTRPGSWPDDWSIPESHNGVPDILDEAKWEIDWLLRMQTADGSVLHKVSVLDWSAASPPSKDNGVRRYAPATASATISACGVFAHAARVFARQPQNALQNYARRLQAAAERAWLWLERHPRRIPSSYDNRGFKSAVAEDSAYWQKTNRLRAALYLYGLTNDTKYRSFFDRSYRTTHMFVWSAYLFPFEQPFNTAWLEYASLRGATPSVAADIRAIHAKAGKWLLDQELPKDAYRAFLEAQHHTWGSNYAKLRQGLGLAAMARFGLDLPRTRAYTNAAEGYLHYVFGVNPAGWTFLTNMRSAGSLHSVQETFHAWFADGTDWDNASKSKFGPAPGILTGGVVRNFKPPSAYQGPPIVPPQNQPVLKSYRDWNTDWPEGSWEVTETQITYQAGLIQLLAEVSIGSPHRLAIDWTDAIAGKPVTFRSAGYGPRAIGLFLWSGKRGRFRWDRAPWCFDLGIQFLGDPGLNILRFGFVPANGALDTTLPLPASLVGATIYLQAAQFAPCPDVLQSGVFGVHVR